MRERPMSSSLDTGTATLSFSGTVDETAVAALSSDIAAGLADCDGTLVIDLSDVDYFPSAAVSALVKATRDDESRVELLAAEGSIVQRVLHLCGLPHRTA